ncbi:MAG TPA: DUF4384 domain-containing protein [Candidatus Xenobia bacterium]
MRRLLLLSLALGCLAGPLWADDNRAAFAGDQTDAMKVTVLQVKSGTEIAVVPHQVFHAGDQVRIRLESNFPGVVYVLNQTPGGETRVLLPQSQQLDVNQVAPHVIQDLPFAPKVMKFDTEKGTEVLQVVMSRSRIPQYDEAVSAHQGKVESIDQVSSGPESRAHREVTGVVALAPAQHPARLACRGLDVSDEDHADEGTIVSVKGGGHLGPQDIAVFEVRLLHQ